MADQISKAAIDLIVFYEVSSKEYYEKLLQVPTWPGVNSGITVGIGYDLGYNVVEDIISDWKGLVPEKTLQGLCKYAGINRDSAKSKISQAKKDIGNIPWDVAHKVFTEKTLPKWTKMTKNRLANTDLLSEDCLGALVSLAYNMGSAWDNPKDKYRENREIKRLLSTKDFDKIPAQIRSLKRNWKEKGLKKRRDSEAALFEKGLLDMKEIMK